MSNKSDNVLNPTSLLGFEESSAERDLKVDPIHHYKYCPRCAARGKFDSSTNSFSCPVCGFTFFLNASAAVIAIIFNHENQLLMVRRAIDPAKGMLDLPGGFVDPGESAEQAVIREINEELNLSPISLTFYGSFPNKYLYSGCYVDTVDLAFELKIDSFAHIKCMDDVASVEFINPEEIDIDSIAFDSAKNILIKLIDERKNCR